MGKKDLMILTFLIGSIFLLVGTVGNDLVSVVSFIVSPENLNKGEGEIALLGEAAETLKVCLNGDGNISSILGIEGGQEEELENLKSNLTLIEQLILEFKDIDKKKETYNNYNTILEKRDNFSSLDYGLKDTNGEYKYKLLNAFNNINTGNTYEELSFQCPTDKKLRCDSTLTITDPKQCFDLKDCKDEKIETRYSSANTDLKDNAKIMDEILAIQRKANTNAQYGIKYAIEAIKNKYQPYLTGEITGLVVFYEAISSITNIFDDLVGKNDKFLSFLNCKFMGKNIKVVLKFLEKSLGGHFKTVAICLVISGFSLAIAIIFTILLMSILKENAGK